MTCHPVVFHPPAKADSPLLTPLAWPVDDVLALFNLPFNDLLFRAQQVHR
ncbi:MAG: biotin synthase BioB, partial [Noviherbaspirillum sp.]